MCETFLGHSCFEKFMWLVSRANSKFRVMWCYNEVKGRERMVTISMILILENLFLLMLKLNTAFKVIDKYSKYKLRYEYTTKQCKQNNVLVIELKAW